MPFVLEGLVTSVAADGAPHLAPMGPEIVGPPGAIERLVLKPFQTSTTYQNLRRAGCGVFHVTDDVELLARAAVGGLAEAPRWLADHPTEGRWILADACRWYAFEIRSLDDRAERVRMEAEVVASGRLRDFAGFNRAQFAVLEAAILATRVAWLPPDEIFAQLDRLRPLVEKTGGAAEERAWAFLAEFFRARLGR